MLKGEPITAEDLLGELSPEERQALERAQQYVSKLVGQILSHEAGAQAQTAPSISPYQGTQPQLSPGRGGLSQDVSDALSKALDILSRMAEKLGKSEAIFSLPDLYEQAVKRAVDNLMKGGKLDERSARRIQQATEEAAKSLRKMFNSPTMKKHLIENFDPTKLSPEEWQKLIDAIMDYDMKNAGRGEGGGIADIFLTKILVSPQFRYRLKEYLRDLRVAPSEVESYHPIGKRIDPRRTFLRSTQTGLPMLVFKKPLRKPRAREDIIFIYDVSGSMVSYFALISSIAQTLSDLGLHVKVYYAEEGAVKATSRNFIDELKRFGGGGTNLAGATEAVLRGEDLRHTVVILYSDLYEGVDAKAVVDNLDKMRFRGSKVAVFATECTVENERIREVLESRGIMVKCDVTTPRKFIDSLRDLRVYIKKAAVIR